MRSASLGRLLTLGLLVSYGCGGSDDGGRDLLATGGLADSGGAQPDTGGTVGSGGLDSSAGMPPSTGGTPGTGGSATGGVPTGGSSSGGASTGGFSPTGGTTGGVSTGGGGTGGVIGPPTGGGGTGGEGTGGEGTGGEGTGGEGTGGEGTGGEGTGGEGTGGGSTVDCDTPMPSGGTRLCGQNTQDTAGGFSWSLWSNSMNSDSCITTFDTTSFSASWGESGDFLARFGLEFQDPIRYTDYGTLETHYAFNKTGSGGSYSYIGMYGRSNEPCVEWYIVDDSYSDFPFTPWGSSPAGFATIDGEEYRFYEGTIADSRCSGGGSWHQFWSVRQSARQCGVISVTDHFDAWAAEGMEMGVLLEVSILVEVGGGSGSIDFPVANVIAE